MNERGSDVGGGEAFFEEDFEEVILFAELAALEGFAEAADERAGAGFFDFVGGGRLGAVDAHFGVPLDVVDLKEFAAGDERDGASAAAGATGAAYAVDVIFDVVGEVVVENDFDIFDVDAAGGDVSGDEEFEVGAAEFVHDAVAHGLAHVAVEPVGGVALGVEVVSEVVNHAFGVAEDDAEFEVVDVDEAGEEFDFEAAIDFVENLFDGGDGDGFLFDADVLGIAGVFADEIHDRARQGGGEENGLAFGGDGFEDEIDIVAEAHVEHDVGFVEDDHANFVEAK